MFTDLLRSLFRRQSVDRDLDDELRFHLDRESEKLRRSGLSRTESLRQASISLGGLQQVKEQCREARGIAGFESALQDLRYAIRGMRRTPAFAAAAVLTLGFGAAAVATVFTFANTLFFRSLPASRPDELVHVNATRRQGRSQGWVSYPDYLHFRDRTTTLQSLAAHYSNAPFFVSNNQQSRELTGAVVSANFFPVLGIIPAFGRFFLPEEDRVPGRDRVAVLGYDLWRNWFGASPDALGGTVRINGVAFTIVGVAPPTFRGMTYQSSEIYIPTMMAQTGFRWCQNAFAADCNAFSMIGRLADGKTVEEANAEVAELAASWWTNAVDGQNSGATAISATGISHPDISRRDSLRFIQPLIAVAFLLLLVCCANLAGMLAARNSARAPEFAIRSSLGAAGGRLVRQLVTESILLAAAGGVAGVLLSMALTAALNAAFYSVDFAGHSLHYDFTLEPRVVLAALAVSAIAGLLLGLVPALKSIRGGPGATLKRSTTAIAARSRLGGWLVGSQATVAVGLVAVAGLLTSGARQQIAGTNFEASHIALLRVRPLLVRYSPEKAAQLQHAIVDRLQRLPAVESVSMAGNGGVLHGQNATVSLPGKGAAEGLQTGYLEIGPRYFETLRTAVLWGREFDHRDSLDSPPVTIVSEALARRLWPQGGVIGATLLVKGRPHQVVGITKDVRQGSRVVPVQPYVYVPYWQKPGQLDSRLAVRVKGDPAAMLQLLSREVARIDPDVPVAEAITLPSQIAASLQSLRITASFISYAAILAVFLSAIGLYAALSFSVSRRTKEIGIRMALGARVAEVRTMVIREGMWVIAAGSAGGIGLAAGGVRFVRYLMYGTGAADPYWYAGAALLVMAVGLFACWIPARRATRVEPLSALRDAG